MTAQNTYTGTTTVSAGTLRLNRTGGNTIPVTNNVVVSGGTLQISTNQTINNLDLTGTGSLTIDAGVTLTVNGTYTPGSGTITNNGTLVLAGTGDHLFPTGSVAAMNNLTISKSSGTVTLNSALTLAGNLSITAGILNANGNDISIYGDWTRASGATFTPSTGTVTFTGTNAQTITISGGGTA
ncbi:MAG: hypothetical protein ACOVOV_07135, partial [Dolichospermum sp.]